MPRTLFVKVWASVRLCLTVGLWVYLLKRRKAVSGMEVEQVIRGEGFDWGLPSLWEASSDVKAMWGLFHSLLLIPCPGLHLCL